MKVKSITEAWQAVSEIFPAHFEKDEPKPAEMHEYIVTIGLFDKHTEKQEISIESAKKIISNVLIEKFDIFAFTMIDCFGVYKMQSTGRIVYEPSIRVEIASDDEINITDIINIIKDGEHLNQESIMIKHSISDISFK